MPARFTLAVVACALFTSQAHALLSNNVTQDDTITPEPMVRMVTAESGYGNALMVADSETTSEETPDTCNTPSCPLPVPIPYPNTGSSAVPEPVGLGVLGAFVAILGGLHRRRLA